MALEGNNQQQIDNIEVLRCILESQHSRAFTYEEASEIGGDLLGFFEVLGQDTPSQSQELEPIEDSERVEA